MAIKNLKDFMVISSLNAELMFLEERQNQLEFAQKDFKKGKSRLVEVMVSKLLACLNDSGKKVFETELPSSLQKQQNGSKKLIFKLVEQCVDEVLSLKEGSALKESSAVEKCFTSTVLFIQNADEQGIKNWVEEFNNECKKLAQLAICTVKSTGSGLCFYFKLL